MNILKRLYLILFAVFFVVTAGSYGYYILFRGEHNLMDCIYMTVISLTSVGYGEVIEVTGNIPAEIFTMILITFGMGIILYGISTLTALIIEGELSGILRKKKIEKQIKKLKGHYIVCGGGETGRPVLLELSMNHEQVVLIEHAEGNIEKCKNTIADLLYINGDATDDINLIAAGIERASGILITLPLDKDCLYVTTTARMLNKKIRIISRMIEGKLEPKLMKAGANGVVSSNAIGALRMASQMIRPAAVDFLDQMLRSSQGNLRINEIRISENSSVSGKKIGESGLKEKLGLLILGMKQIDGEIEFNPSPSQVLKEGATLIVMGAVENITRAKKAF
ncbi:potassium channel protein [Desulfobacteraceae bacterium SEEP-SAG9]|nr:potassium channel protein [Desulfobacteraceae bacterium SEEP-SAG9]